MEILKSYALSFLGKPYKYGGASPFSGMDCSGFICELLKSTGEIPFHSDMSAHQLFDHFVTNGNGSQNVWQLGSIAFFGTRQKIVHVGMLLDQYRMIEFSGGDETVKDLTSAEQAQAFCRIRLVYSRKDFVVTIKPYYRRIGMI